MLVSRPTCVGIAAQCKQAQLMCAVEQVFVGEFGGLGQHGSDFAIPIVRRFTPWSCASSARARASPRGLSVTPARQSERLLVGKVRAWHRSRRGKSTGRTPFPLPPCRADCCRESWEPAFPLEAANTTCCVPTVVGNVERSYVAAVRSINNPGELRTLRMAFAVQKHSSPKTHQAFVVAEASFTSLLGKPFNCELSCTETSSIWRKRLIEMSIAPVQAERAVGNWDKIDARLFSLPGLPAKLARRVSLTEPVKRDDNAINQISVVDSEMCPHLAFGFQDAHLSPTDQLAPPHRGAEVLLTEVLPFTATRSTRRSNTVHLDLHWHRRTARSLDSKKDAFDTAQHARSERNFAA